MKKRNKKARFRKKGFTLIELLVTITILSVLFAAVLFALNPQENINKSRDFKVNALAQDFAKASLQYLTEGKSYPWVTNQNCNNELSPGGLLADMPDCIHELAKGGNLEKDYTAMSEIKEIYAAKCNDSAILCFNPKSKLFDPEEAKYTKYGAQNPACPPVSGTSPNCFVCIPVANNINCQSDGSNTPTPAPSIPPTTPTFATNIYDDIVPGYKIDDTKFFRTYAVYFFNYPGFPYTSGSGWNMQLSLHSDFSGDYTQTINSFGIPDHYSQDAPANVSYTALRNITAKYVGFASTPYNYSMYTNNCGKTVYWRITNYYSPTATNKLTGPTYTGVIDCNTKVGIVDPPISWYSVFDQVANQQKQYNAAWDLNNSGAIDWTDYWLATFSTKARYGGWQPPE